MALLMSSCASIFQEPPLKVPRPRLNGSQTVTETIFLRESGVYDFKNVLHVWKGPGKCGQTEYQHPILHVMVSGVTVKNFAFKNAPDGVHVGGLPWTSRNAVRSHPEVVDVTFLNLQAVNICEDAFTCQKNTRAVTIRDSHFWGGEDKMVQNDHCRDLRILNTGFYNGVCAIRWKANTTGEVRDCRFVRVDYPVKADGDAWPTGSASSRRRTGGPVRVVAAGNSVDRAKVGFWALRNATVIGEGNVFRMSDEDYRDSDGGKVLVRR
jgi:hypothetical protein